MLPYSVVIYFPVLVLQCSTVWETLAMSALGFAGEFKCRTSSV